MAVLFNDLNAKNPLKESRASYLDLLDDYSPVKQGDKEVGGAEDRGISNILRKESCGKQGIMKDEVRGEDREQRTENRG